MLFKGEFFFRKVQYDQIRFDRVMQNTLYDKRNIINAFLPTRHRYNDSFPIIVFVLRAREKPLKFQIVNTSNTRDLTNGASEKKYNLITER